MLDRCSKALKGNVNSDTVRENKYTEIVGNIWEHEGLEA